MARFKDQFVMAGGIRTRYWAAGTGGVPLILLHGLGGTLEDWAGTLRPLAERRQVVAIDLLGCGQTDKPLDASYAPEMMRDHVLATLDALGIERAVLNGWSLGGRIALEVAHAAPDRVHQLVLTAPAGVGPDTILDFNAPLLNLAGQILMRPGESGLRLISNAIRNEGSIRLMKFAARRASLVTDARTRTAFMRQLRSFVGPSGYLPKPRLALVAKLPDIATPTLAIWGRQDNFAPYAHSRILLEHMPQCELHSIDSCGHTPHIEHPDAYVRAVNGFLD